MERLIQTSTFNKLNNKNGFTLIEVLIAIGLLSGVMLGIISITDNTFETAERVTREDKELLAVETAFARLEWDLSQLYSPFYFSHELKPDGMSEDEGEIYNNLIDKYQRNSKFNLLSYNYIPIPQNRLEDKNTLTVFTSSNRRKLENLKQSNFAWIRYTLEENDEEISEEMEQKTAKEAQETKMLVRKVSNTNIYNPEEIEWDKIKSQVLFRKVMNLKYEFWNPETKKWTDNLDLIKHGANFIRAIKITMDYLDADNIEKQTVRIFRPLFPNFKPEDMYKFLNANPNTNQTNNAETNNNSNEENSNEAE